MKLPDARNALLILGEDMDDGLKKNVPPIPVKQNLEPDFRLDLDNVYKAETQFGAADAAKKKLSTALTVADSNGKAFLALSRKMFATAYGERWTQEWEATGFPNRSTAIPNTQAEREALLKSVKLFLEANPDMEVVTPKVVFTAAKADTLFLALAKARKDVVDGNVAARKKRIDCDAVVEKLRIRMRGLIDELTQLLPKDDPTWLAFGLPLPGATNLPDSPDGLVLTPGQAGEVHSDWHNAARATYYRVFVMIVGEDQGFVHKLNVHDSDCTLSGLPSGKTVRIQIISGNEAGYSESVMAEIVVP